MSSGFAFALASRSAMKDTASAGSGILTLASPPEEGAPAGAAPGRAAPAPGPGRGAAGERIRVQTVRPAARNSVSTAEPAVVSCQRLAAEDSAKRCAAVRALAPTGRAVIEAATGADALAVLRRGGDFIVLLALALPDMDGRDLLARIAADHPDTPAVIVTGVDDVAVAIDAMQRGAWDYVVGRADGSHLLHLSHVVARTLERRRQLVRDRNRYREEMEGLAIALRGTSDGVVILDPIGRLAFVNPALARAWGQPESAIVGRLLGDFVSVHGAPADLGDVLAAVGERGLWSGELCARAVEPPERVWDVTLTPIRSPEPAPGVVLGHARTAVGIFRDVSEKHALEQLRADFLSMITHDIKVPLTVILGYTEMLTDPEPPPDQIPPDIL